MMKVFKNIKQAAVGCDGHWHSSIRSRTYKPSELGPTDLAFGLWSEFISSYERAGLQVSTFSSYDLFHPG